MKRGKISGVGRRCHPAAGCTPLSHPTKFAVGVNDSFEIIGNEIIFDGKNKWLLGMARAKMTEDLTCNSTAAEQIVGRERRERVSQLDSSGDA